MGELQCFTVWRGEVSDRLDPHFYHPRFEKLLAALRRGPHEILGNIAKLCHQKWNPDENPKDTFRYIEINSVSRETGEASFSKLPIKKAPSRAQLIVQKDDIIISLTRPHHGSIALINDDLDGCIASTGFAILREIKDPTLNRTYLYSVLRSQLCLLQMLQRSSGGNYPAITTDQLTRILIPIPETNIQNHIANFMRSAYTKKKQKEQEASALLDSIDDYVLTELGIEMPEIEEKKCFVVYASETTGRRIDPRFHQSKYQEIIRVLESGKYSIMPLFNLMTDLKNGVEIRTYSDHGYRYLRVSDLGKNGIECNDPRYVDIDEIPDRVRLTNNSFLISRSGSLGLVSVIEDEIRNTVLGSDIFKVELDTESIHPRYLETFFRSQIGQTLIFQLNSGSIIPRLDQPAVKALRVVVPPFDVQEKIINEVMKRQSEAAKLRQEANAIVDQAKERVERMLLAEE